MVVDPVPPERRKKASVKSLPGKSVRTDGTQEAPPDRNGRIPEPTVLRLPLYYRSLLDLKSAGVRIVSSDEMARRTGIKASQFRKDLSCFGEFGVQGVGYPVDRLLDRIADIMRINRTHPVVLVGAGNLGSALINYKGFPEWGFHIVQIFDASPARIGHRLGHVKIRDMADLPEPLQVPVGIIAVPAEGAARVCELLVQSGVRAILNFSGAKLPSSSGVVVRNVDLADELAVLAYYLSKTPNPERRSRRG